MKFSATPHKILILAVSLAPAWAQQYPSQQYPAQQTDDDYSRRRPAAAAQIGSPAGDNAQVQPNAYPQGPENSYPQGPQGNYPQGPQGGSPASAQDAPPPPPPQQQGNGFPRFPSSQQRPPQPRYDVPATIDIAPGKYIDVRVDNYLSSDRNQAGDGFSATLEQPLVVDGVVLAQQGQRISGRVVESEKAGRVKGVSHLRLELTELNLVDGQQIPIKTSLINRKGNTSYGRDAFGIGATTAVGAAIGAGVNGGVGAGVGAAAGLVVGTLGVLFTRGQPTVVTPETVLTFRIENPVTVSTVRSPGAFHTVDRRDYAQGGAPRLAQRPTGYGYPPPTLYPPYAYGGYPYWGPSVYVGVGPRYNRYRRW